MEILNNQASISLGNLRPPKGSRKKRVRVGRGIGSGLGKTSGRGGKGQTARSGKGRPRGFEGGQTPLVRRLPKYGFNNPFRKEYLVVDVKDLDSKFSDSDVVGIEDFYNKRLISSKGKLVKILGDGEIKKKLTVRAHGFSKSAVQKIQQCGGKIEVLLRPKKNPEEEQLGSN